MTSKGEHKKHGDLERAKLGRFGRDEVAIYGTTCEDIKLFVSDLRNKVSGFDIAYVDADHNEHRQSIDGTHWQWQLNGAYITRSIRDNDYFRRISLNHTDMVIVNGNHFEATDQLVICNPEKEQSLRKRKDQLKNVVGLICEGEIPSYIKEVIADYINIPVFRPGDFDAIADFVKNKYLKPAPLNALILTGGKSIRMGKDKSKINYHGKEQSLHLADLVAQLSIPVYISCREDQKEFFESNQYKVITDRIHGIGPLGGIASAFMSRPDDAWVVLACDLPLLDQSVISELVSKRNSAAVATSFKSPHDQFPEPLIAIWEPKSYPLLMQFIAQGISCPRKVLLNSEAHIIEPTDPDKLTNVNTPDDLEDILHEIS